MTLEITICAHNGINQTITALLDTGADNYFINSTIINEQQLKPKPLTRPLNLTTATGEQSKITHAIDLQTTFMNHTATITYLITPLGKTHAIFGLPWFYQYKPTIDWHTNSVNLNRLTIATKLAKEVNASKTDDLDLIPSEYHGFLPVFQTSTNLGLPPSRSCDHAIDLVPGAVERRFRYYTLSEDLLEELKAFLKEHLSRGTIRESKSPMASPFFFVDKKRRQIPTMSRLSIP